MMLEDITTLDELKLAGLRFVEVSLSSGHYRVWHPSDPQRLFDFWPATKKFYGLKGRESGRGVFELIEHLKV